MPCEIPPPPPSAPSSAAVVEVRIGVEHRPTLHVVSGRATVIGPDGVPRGLVRGAQVASSVPFHVELGALGEMTVTLAGRASARLFGPAALQAIELADGRVEWTLLDAEACEIETRTSGWIWKRTAKGIPSPLFPRRADAFSQVRASTGASRSIPVSVSPRGASSMRR